MGSKLTSHTSPRLALIASLHQLDQPSPVPQCCLCSTLVVDQPVRACGVPHVALVLFLGPRLAVGAEFIVAVVKSFEEEFSPIHLDGARKSFGQRYVLHTSDLDECGMRSSFDSHCFGHVCIFVCKIVHVNCCTFFSGASEQVVDQTEQGFVRQFTYKRDESGFGGGTGPAGHAYRSRVG